MKVKITVNKNFIIDEIDNRIYGSFVEHIGRAVYGGIYEPTHETADDMGFRRDVLELAQELDVPIIRYPGGNFLSAYNWEDGTGEKSKRPQKLEPAWKSIETNEVGIDEFQEWAKRANSSVMMAVNLGTRGADEARECLEYCNLDTPTYYAEMRRKNGFEKPFGIKTWCLGNEMGGLAQICRKTPEEYGRLAAETAKLMKLTDPEIELVVCGSSHRNMPRFGEWELVVLNHTYEFVDYISIHQYYACGDSKPEDFLAKSADLDNYIKSVTAMCDAIKAYKHSEKTMLLSFDEWNIFGEGLQLTGDKWEVAPVRFECTYTFEEALVVGCMMMTLQNNCDRVKIACLAQLVNVIAPIMTETGGKVWKQTIFYPFLYASRYGRGTVMQPIVNCDTYSTEKHKDIPYIETSVIHNSKENELVVFAVNRSVCEEAELESVFENFGECTLVEHIELYSDDLKAVNSKDFEAIKPNSVTDGEKVILKKHSWNMLRYTYGHIA